MKDVKDIAPNEYEQKTGYLSDVEFWMACLDALIDDRRCSDCGHDGLRFKGPDFYLTYEGFRTGTVCWYMFVFNGYRLTMAARTQKETIQKAILFFYSEFESLDQAEYRERYFTNPNALTKEHPLITELSKYKVANGV
ncbi:hypothetical protein Lepto7375DRAFT_7282 [Leptolyngbya sp. PCC 7375]|nr:hypothetical protein Lepto7375DRAFT_7282 [Leptolyngbya sp. PCC 7375]